MKFRWKRKYQLYERYYERRNWPRRLLFGVVLMVCLVGATAGVHALLDGPKPTMKHRQTSSHRHKPFGLAVGDELVWLNNEQLDHELSGMRQLGVGWIRIDISWADVQPNDTSQYDWSNLDRVVQAAHKYQMRILGTVAYTPAWARPADCRDSQSCAPANDHQFAAFARAAAARYARNGISSWEVWNEENNAGFWQPTPNPKAYTQLLAASYKAIKAANPQATVITGGLGPVDGNAKSIQQQAFLSGMYAAGAKSYFNAVGYHPYSYPAPPSVITSWSGWASMAALPNSIRSIMIAHGDGNKKIWITEYGAPTNGPGALATTMNLNFGQHADHVSNALQAEMLAQATSQYKSDRWLGNFFWYEYQDQGASKTSNENFFGLLTHAGAKKSAYYVYQKAMR